MNYYKKSKKILKEKIKEDRKISKTDWDNYAASNCLFSSNTLMFHVEAKSFEDLKERLL